MTTATYHPSGGFDRPLHPLHALLLAGSVPLFLGVLLSDVAYANSAQVQWKNFASWLNAGALLFSGLALLWALIGLFTVAGRRRRPLLSALLLLVGWVIGFINTLVHAKDAAASLPEGVVLAAIVFVVMAVASWLGLAATPREVRA